MRPLGSYGRFLVAIPAGAALAVSGLLTGSASAGTTAPAGAAVTRAAAPAAHRLPDFGNTGGHAAVPQAGAALNTSHPDHVIGTGTPASCTSAAVVKAVARGGVITFRCGPKPVTITMTPCAPKQKWTPSDCYDQQWPQLTVQNITLKNGNSQVRQSQAQFGGGGGGALFDEGGQLKVVNSRFPHNRCYKSGPDLGGAAIRALAQYRNRPVYITRDTFSGGRCSNGGALSSIGVSWVVLNSVMTNNKAIGYGANPANAGTAGGGSGGAIYTDGNKYKVRVEGTVIRNNHAREGGGAIFFVSDNNTGWLTIKNSTLHGNPSAVFWTRPYPGIYFHSSGRPRVINSAIG